MTTLVELARACRDASTLRVCERFAEDFVCLVGPALRQFIFRHARPDLAEDAFQETLITIATHVGQCTARTDSGLWGWCYKVARNKMADQGRRAERHPTISLDVEWVRRVVEASGADERIGHDEREEVDYALQLLGAVKPPCVDYLWEAIGLNQPYEAVGQLHGLSADAARMQVNRCLKLARELVRKKAKVSHV